MAAPILAAKSSPRKRALEAALLRGRGGALYHPTRTRSRIRRDITLSSRFSKTERAVSGSLHVAARL